MKEEFETYLKSIGIVAKQFHEKVEAILQICSELCPEEMVDVFVDEYIKEDGTRVYEDITFFSEGYHFGAKQFLTEDNFIINKSKNKVIYYRIKKNDYDFKKATEKSRLNLEAHYDMPGIVGNFKASGENCDFLKQIILKYIAPYLKD